MARFDYLLGGKWVCEPKRTLTFEVAPNNTIHEHAVADTEEADSYVAYSSGASTYSMTTANNYGFYGYLVSSDGIRFSGDVLAGPVMRYPEKMTLTKLPDGTLHIRDEVIENGTLSSEAACRRAP